MTAKSSKNQSAPPPKPPRTRTSSVTYPYHPLALCLDLVKAVADHSGAGQAAVPLHLLASQLKVSEASGDFRLKTVSAKCYGLIEGKGEFRLTDTGRKLTLPIRDPAAERKEALLNALGAPGAFRALLARYDGVKLPSVELMGNLLCQECGIPQTWKNRVATFFVRSCETAGAIVDGFLRHKTQMAKLAAGSENGGGGTDDNGGDDDDDVDGGGSDERGGKDDPTKKNKKIERRETPEGVSVWTYPVGDKMLRIETPEGLTLDAWNKLNLYLQVIKPNA